MLRERLFAFREFGLSNKYDDFIEGTEPCDHKSDLRSHDLSSHMKCNTMFFLESFFLFRLNYNFFIKKSTF